MSDTPVVNHEIKSGVVADWADHRDADFTPLSVAPAPPELELGDYRALADETWHQRGEECTGFALAAIANYLMRRHHDDPDLPSVSRRMLYEMAQRHDGAMHVEGSTLRGALKGWSRVGVASDEHWPYHPNDEHGAVHGTLNLNRILDGRTRPLMGYRRIKHDDIGVMQHALAEGHPLYVAARTHVGWYRLFLHDAGTKIERLDADTDRGIHAFVVIGYNADGFVIHNSWGPEWGDDGYAVLPYDQWTWGATDTWVVHAGIDAAPIDQPAEPTAESAKQTYRDMWPHLVVLDDHGQLAATGLHEMDHGSVKTLLYLFDEYTRAHNWNDRKLALIVDDGADSTAATIEKLRPLRDKLLKAQVYPIFVVWQTSWRSELEHELATWTNHRTGDRLPKNLATKVAASESRSAAIWNAIRGRSIQACISATGGARLLAQSIAYKRGQRYFDVHGVSFGAGDVLLAPLTTILPSPINSVLTIGPTTTMADFEVTYRGMLAQGLLQNLTVVPATDAVADLVSAAWSLDGASMRHAGRQARLTKTWSTAPVPLLGLRRDIESSTALRHFASSEQFELNDTKLTKSSTTRVHKLIVDHIGSRPPTVEQPQTPGLPTDPLTRAEILHAIQP